MIATDLMGRLNKRNGSSELVGGFPDAKESLEAARKCIDKPSAKLQTALNELAVFLINSSMANRGLVLQALHRLESEEADIEAISQTANGVAVVIVGKIRAATLQESIEDFKQDWIESRVRGLRDTNKELRQHFAHNFETLCTRLAAVTRSLQGVREFAGVNDPNIALIEQFCERMKAIQFNPNKPEGAIRSFCSENLDLVIEPLAKLLVDPVQGNEDQVSKFQQFKESLTLRPHILRKLAKENLRELGREPMLNPKQFSPIELLLLTLQTYENAGNVDPCTEPDSYRYEALLEELSQYELQDVHTAMAKLKLDNTLSENFAIFIDLWINDKHGKVAEVTVEKAAAPTEATVQEQERPIQYVTVVRLCELGLREDVAKRIAKICTQDEFDERRLALAACWKGRDLADRAIRDNPNILAISKGEFAEFIVLLQSALSLVAELPESDALSAASNPLRFSGKESVQKVLSSLAIRQEFNALIEEINNADLKIDGRTAMAILRYGFCYRGTYVVGGMRLDSELVHLRQNLNRHVDGVDGQRDLIARTVKKLVSLGAINDSQGLSLQEGALSLSLRKTVTWILKVNDPRAGEFEFGSL